MNLALLSVKPYQSVLKVKKDSMTEFLMVLDWCLVLICLHVMKVSTDQLQMLIAKISQNVNSMNIALLMVK